MMEKLKLMMRMRYYLKREDLIQRIYQMLGKEVVIFEHKFVVVVDVDVVV